MCDVFFSGLSKPTFKDQKDPFDPDKFYRLYKGIVTV